MTTQQLQCRREPTRAHLAEAIRSLPDQCRRVMTLRIVYDLPQRGIAEKLGISDHVVAAELAIGTMKCTEFALRRNEEWKALANSPVRGWLPARL